MRIEHGIITRVQQANDIVDVISEHISLARKGREMVGLCPFHEDHRPSMYVNPVKQIFKCFACSAGGDVLKFIQMREGLTFPQAIERLAERKISEESIKSWRLGLAPNAVDALAKAAAAKKASLQVLQQAGLIVGSGQDKVVKRLMFATPDITRSE